MCLNRLRHPTDEWPKYQREDGDIIGFKTFKGDNRYLYPIVRGNVEKCFPQNQWINELDYRDESDKNEEHIGYLKYPFGFHVNFTLEGAQSWAGEQYVVKVREVVAQGFQENHPVIVAKEMMILRKVK